MMPGMGWSDADIQAVKERHRNDVVGFIGLGGQGPGVEQVFHRHFGHSDSDREVRGQQACLHLVWL